jgi:hypothetical protein
MMGQLARRRGGKHRWLMSQKSSVASSWTMESCGTGPNAVKMENEPKKKRLQLDQPLMKKHPVISLDEGGFYVKGNEARKVRALTEETHIDVAETYGKSRKASQDASDHT